MKTKLIALCLLAGPVFAQDAPGPATVALRPGWAENDHHIAGIEIILAPGWHTYWRAPGEAGIPPMLDWSGSENVASVQIAWPVPQVFAQNGMTTVGYEDRVILPLIVRLTDPARPAQLRGHLAIGVCKEVCTPFSADVSADLTGPGAMDTAIAKALADQPAQGKSRVTCRAEPIADGLRLTTEIAEPTSGAAHVVMELVGADVWVSEAIVSQKGASLVASADMVPPDAKPFALDRSRLRLTILTPGQAIELNGCTGG